jgi:hypothetical protein
VRVGVGRPLSRGHYADVRAANSRRVSGPPKRAVSTLGIGRYVYVEGSLARNFASRDAAFTVAAMRGAPHESPEAAAHFDTSSLPRSREEYASTKGVRFPAFGAWYGSNVCQATEERL